MRIEPLDQIELPLAVPLLDLPLALEGGMARFVLLEPNYILAAMGLREPIEYAMQVLTAADGEVVRMTRIERPIALVGDDIR